MIECKKFKQLSFFKADVITYQFPVSVAIIRILEVCGGDFGERKNGRKQKMDTRTEENQSILFFFKKKRYKWEEYK
jgi:hypothetical protein